MHWAAKYIGRPWEPGGCWRLVRDVFLDRYGITMPEVRLNSSGEAENVAALKQAAEVSGWRRADGEAQADDIALVTTRLNERHVGLMISTRTGLRIMHCDGQLTERGPVGSTEAVSLREALADGYTAVELWRRA